MVNLQDTPTAGPLRACDLDRATNTGRIYHLHRVHVEPSTATDDETEALYRQACAVEGGTFADPVPSGSVLSMRRHHHIRTTVGLAIALAVAVYLWHVALPLLG